jgi:phosphatidylglycerophosphatase A
MARVDLFFEVEGLRINIRSILARLELLFPNRPALWAAGPYDFLVREEANRKSWTLARDMASAGLYVLFAPGDRISDIHLRRIFAGFEGVSGGAIVRECDTATSEDGMGTGWSLVKRFRPYHSIGHYTSYLVRRAGVPRGLVVGMGNLLRRFGIGEAVGDRYFKVTLRGNEERFFGTQTSPATHVLNPPFDARDIAMSFLGIGHFGMAPGTVASLVTALLLYGVSFLGGTVLCVIAWITAAISTIGCIWFESWSAQRYFAKDARQVVLDEVAGQSLLIAMMPLAQTPWHFVMAFLLFRVFDIFKPGVHWIEKRNWRGSIVYDDLLAGFYGVICAHAINALGWWPFVRHG